MTHAAAIPSAQHFHDLPTALHRVVASYLHAYEAMATDATERAMEALYPASITDAFIQPRLLSEFEEDGEDLSICGWDLYSGRQGASLACLLARLPFLKVIRIYYLHRMVLYHAIFLQPCKQLQSIEFEFVGEDPGGLSDDSGKGTYYPEGPSNPGPSLLNLAMLKGHLPSFEKLEVAYEDDFTVVAEAVRAGQLTYVKELHITSSDDKPPLHLRLLLEAFLTHQEKLKAFRVQFNRSIALELMRQLLASPVCSDLHTLGVSPVYEDDDSRVMLFVSDFLRSAGAGGKPSFRELRQCGGYFLSD